MMMEIQEAIERIKDVPVRGPYSNNIVGAILRMVANEHGTEAADKIVVSLKLQKKFQIFPQGDKKSPTSSKAEDVGQTECQEVKSG